MTRETVENILYSIIKRNLKSEGFMPSNDVLDLFEKYCGNSEDLDEIFEILTNSKKFNYVLLQNGESYFVGKDKTDWQLFFINVEISDRDEVWNEFFYYNNSSERLRDIWEEVANV